MFNDVNLLTCTQYCTTVANPYPDQDASNAGERKGKLRGFLLGVRQSLELDRHPVRRHASGLFFSDRALLSLSINSHSTASVFFSSRVIHFIALASLQVFCCQLQSIQFSSAECTFLRTHTIAHGRHALKRHCSGSWNTWLARRTSLTTCWTTRSNR